MMMTIHWFVAVLFIASILLWAEKKKHGIRLEAYDQTEYFPIQIDDATNALCHPENNLIGSLFPVWTSHQREWCRSHSSSERTSRQLRSPNQGTVRALVLLLQFPEHEDRNLPSREYFDSLCNVNISDYFDRQSYGQYDVTCDVMPWVTLPYSQEFFANAYSNLVGREYSSEFFLPVLDDIPDLSIYDANQDGAIDVVMALHSGYAAEYRRGQSCGAPEPRHRFHSQGHPDSPVDTYVRNGTRLAGYGISSVYDFVCTDDPAGIGVIAHEWLHVLRGLPDLYDPSTGRIGGIAAFDIMASVKGPIFGEGPSSMTAFSRIRAGWMEATEILFNGMYTLLPLNTHPHAFIIHQGFANNEYLLIENRPAVDDDEDLFGGGLLVFHVDDNKRAQGQTDWPLLQDHYKVSVIQADGRYDIEQGNNNGDSDDFWKPGSVLSGNQTDSYYNGPTGISMSVISYDDDGSIVIEISGMLDPPDTAAPTDAPTMIVPSTSPLNRSSVPSVLSDLSSFPSSNGTIPSPAPSIEAGFVEVPWVEVTAPSDPPSQVPSRDVERSGEEEKAPTGAPVEPPSSSAASERLGASIWFALATITIHISF